MLEIRATIRVITESEQPEPSQLEAWTEKFQGLTERLPTGAGVFGEPGTLDALESRV